MKTYKRVSIPNLSKNNNDVIDIVAENDTI